MRTCRLVGRLTAKGRGRPRRSDPWRNVSPQDRVKAAVSMTKVVTRLCIDSIKEKEPWLTEEELIAKARARFMFGREVRR